jgi:hypothetical protein
VLVELFAISVTLMLGGVLLFFGLNGLPNFGKSQQAAPGAARIRRPPVPVRQAGPGSQRPAFFAASASSAPEVDTEFVELMSEMLVVREEISRLRQAMEPVTAAAPAVGTASSDRTRPRARHSASHVVRGGLPGSAASRSSHPES